MTGNVIPLADASDVEEMLGRPLTSAEQDRVSGILDKASELFRRRSGQQFTPGESTVRLKVTAGHVTLVQRPVVSVESVTDDCDGGRAVRHNLFASQLRVHGIDSGEFVRVTYTHGGDVPDAVRLCIADLARRVLEIAPAAVSGVTQHGETTGPFTEQNTYAAWAIGGQTMLSPDDAALAESYRVRTRGSIIQSAGPRPTRWY